MDHNRKFLSHVWGAHIECTHAVEDSEKLKTAGDKKTNKKVAGSLKLKAAKVESCKTSKKQSLWLPSVRQRINIIKDSCIIKRTLKIK